MALREVRMKVAQNTLPGRLDPSDTQKSNTGVSWKPLAHSWTNQHGQFEQIWRQGGVAIFEQHRNGLLIAYEVIIVQKIPDREAFGKFYPAHEAYPAFGKKWEPNGWSFARQHRERAFEFARQLIQNLELPEKERISSAELLETAKGAACAG
jgi:hypothetical protein